MESLVLRVKRRRSQDPVDVLLLDDSITVVKKKPRSLLQAMEGLTVAPTKFAFRRRDFTQLENVPRMPDGTEQRAKAAAETRLARKLEHRVIDLELSEIECNGAPLRVCVKSTGIPDDQDYVHDEYDLQVAEADTDIPTAYIASDLFEPQLFHDGSSESHDSEDSNAEDRAENEYPDEVEDYDNEDESDRLEESGEYSSEDEGVYD